MAFRTTTFWVIGALCAPMALAEATVSADGFESGSFSGWSVAVTPCTPSSPTAACGASSHCTAQTNGSSQCEYPAGAGVQGTSCSVVSDCAEAYACVDALTTQCAQWCQVSAPSCPVATSCLQFVPGRYVGGVEWGVCI